VNARTAAAVLRLTLSRSRLHGAPTAAAPGNVQALLSSLAQRHPLALVAVATVLGGWLASGRPWRKLLAPALWAAVLPQLVAALGSATRAGWAEVLAALLRHAATPPQPPPGAPAPASAAATPQPPPAPAASAG
jgi:hypothetical protein